MENLYIPKNYNATDTKNFRTVIISNDETFCYSVFRIDKKYLYDCSREYFLGTHNRLSNLHDLLWSQNDTN